MTITAEDVADAFNAALIIPNGPDISTQMADFLNARLASRATARTDDVERVAQLEAEVARLQAKLTPTLFWNDDDPENGYCDPWDIVDESGWHKGTTALCAVREGVELGIRYYAKMEAADDSDTDSDIEIIADTAAEAEAMIDTELARRAALGDPK